MKKHLLVGCLVLILTFATVAAASGVPLINPDTGKNIYAWQKPQTIWSVHLAGSSDAAQGQALILETACHDGVGVRFVAPCLTEPAGGLITVETDNGIYAIPIADYQVAVGFVFVLDHWPNPWPVDPVYLDPITPSMPLFIEWETLYEPGDLTPDELFAALADGRVTVELHDASGQVLSGSTK